MEASFAQPGLEDVERHFHRQNRHFGYYEESAAPALAAAMLEFWWHGARSYEVRRHHRQLHDEALTEKGRAAMIRELDDFFCAVHWGWWQNANQNYISHLLEAGDYLPGHPGKLDCSYCCPTGKALDGTDLSLADYLAFPPAGCSSSVCPATISIDPRRRLPPR